MYLLNSRKVMGDFPLVMVMPVYRFTGLGGSSSSFLTFLIRSMLWHGIAAMKRNALRTVTFCRFLQIVLVSRYGLYRTDGDIAPDCSCTPV